MREFIFGEYSINLYQDSVHQHREQIHKILSGPHLTPFLAEEIKGGDLTIKLRILKDDLWPMQEGFGRTEKYCLALEIDDV